MFNFLRKIFIKNCDDVQNPKVREAHGILASVGGIIINLILFAFKIIVGILTFSMSIIADAVNNLTDFFSCIVNLIGFKVASKPADKDHPYGHERIEYIAGLIISFVIVVAAVLLFVTSTESLINQKKDTAITIYSFIVLGVAIVVKIMLDLFYRSIGKKINSISLKAAMQDSINDAILSTVVLCAQLIQFYMPDLWFMDASVSLVMSLLILPAGFKMVKDTISPLIGLAPKVDDVEKIKSGIKNIPGVLGVHDMMFHSYGPTKVYLTIHIEVDGRLNLFEAHNICDSVEEYLRVKHGIEGTVHIDPLDVASQDYIDMCKYVKNILKDINPALSFHDLRKVDVYIKPRIFFEMEIKEGVKINKSEVAKIVREKLNKKYPNYDVVILFDDNYIG